MIREDEGREETDEVDKMRKLAQKKKKEVHKIPGNNFQN